MALRTPPGARRRATPAPAALITAGALVAVVALLPLAYLAALVGVGGRETLGAVVSERALELLARSALLAVTVTGAAILLALPLAWLTVRTDLPGRRAWTVATTLPLVIPSYIGAYLIVSAAGPSGLLARGLGPLVGIERLPSIYGFPGAWLTLTLFTYPLVLLTVRAALRRLDPQLEEAARGMGRSGWSIFRTVVLPQLGPAIGTGGLLVALYVLSDFGAVSIMRFDSFTRGIYTSYRAGFDRDRAAALAWALVAATLGVLWVEGRLRARGAAYHRSSPGAPRPAGAVPLGRWRWPALALCGGVCTLALLAPAAVLGYWLTRSFAGAADWGRIAAAAGHSLLAGGLAAVAAAACAVPVALLAVRFPSRASALVERASYAGHALPGIVVGLSLVFLATRVALPLYQTLGLLVLAFVILFLPQAVAPARVSLLQVPPRLEEAARSLGRHPLAVARTVTAPLAAGGVLAGAALVFLTAVKELPATILLAPIGFNTLATEIWRSTSVGFFERGAAASLVLLALSAAPLYLLTARERAGVTVQGP